MQRALVGHRVVGFTLEVVRCSRQRLTQIWVPLNKFKQLHDRGAVPAEQPVELFGGQSGPLGQTIAPVEQSGIALGADERDPVGVRCRHLARELLGRFVDRVCSHHPVRRVLATRHDDQPRYWGNHGVFARQLAGLIPFTGQQGPKPGVDAHHVVAGQRSGQQPVGLVEEVVDVGAARGRMR